MTYFRLKKELNWSLRSKGIVVYEGNKKLQIAINTDKNEELFKFLMFLSDFKNSQEIKNYSALTEIEKKDAINYLTTKNFLQSFDHPMNLDRTDLFVNSFPDISFKEFKTYRETCKVVVIGLGTIGSHVVDILIRLGFRHFVIIDGDKVEEKNLSAQSYFASDIGMYNVDVMRDRYRHIVDIESYPIFIDSFSQLQKITKDLKRDDIIINAADDYKLMKSLAESIMNKQLMCKVIESGYGPLLQTAYVISTYEAANIFYDYIEKMTEIDRCINNINENNGSVLNGYMSAFMIGQLILFSFFNKNYKVAEYNFLDNFLEWKEEIRCSIM
ncbi:ThiF family adenylyltransferase [Streptococcus dysgalactiae]|uniref:ThiF family adenylyltransferase n=1 Tax=Streptococcus dysgalactiae TaxID=1334 RepID=UPI0010CAC3A2|nr:ThiF family adenylyltransferase [Streptococcus dysgalactiae]VTS45700.1 Ubiquitin-activating enzyme E1 1 [Streptococcus dysgalactiae subsp. equisimilis]VTT10550.1 Ubiquitin-activating enzyme E1 1 [Streptococcus dysgalactiae subsp. equisimilis]